MYVQLPAVTQLFRLVSSSKEDINAGLEQTESADAVQASATSVADAVYAQPPALMHVAWFSLAVPVKLTELQALDASASY